MCSVVNSSSALKPSSLTYVLTYVLTCVLTYVPYLLTYLRTYLRTYLLHRAEGEPSEAERTAAERGAFRGPNRASALSADLVDLAGWDFVSPEPAGTGARLWQRVRTRLDMLARTQGMSRCELLVYVLLTLAAHPSSRLLVLDCCEPYS